MGFDVTVVAQKHDGQSDRDEIEGIHVRRVSAVPNRFLLKVSMMPGQLRVAHECAPEILHANDPSGGLLGPLHAGWKKYVLTVHGIGVSASEWPQPFRSGARLMQRLSVKGANAVTTTDTNTAHYLKTYREDVTIIPTGVDVDRFSRGRYDRPEILAKDKVNILFVGRLTKVKGLDLLIDSLEHLSKDAIQRIQMTIIGDGPLAQMAREASSRWGCLKVIGEIPHEMLPPFFASADLLLMPSRSEGLPITMLEAMASNLPVLSTGVGGISSYFDDRHYTKIATLSPADVARSIDFALAQGKELEKKASAARSRVVDEFSWDFVARRFAEVYRAQSS